MALLLPGAPEAPVENALPEGGEGERQAVADSGKDLPEGLFDDIETADSDDTDASDIAFAWFAMPVPIVADAPLGIGLPRPTSSMPVPLPATAMPAAELQLPGQSAATAATMIAAAPATSVDSTMPGAIALSESLPNHPAGAVPRAGKPTQISVPKAEPAARVRIEIPALADSARIELPVAPHAPTQLQSTQALVQARSESVQQFAAPLILLQADQPVPNRRAAIESIEGAALTGLGSMVAQTLPVAAAAAAQDAALDMRDDSWMASMIDQIEEMCDAGGTRETNIRLSPDSLGELEITIRQDGDKIHVRFNADTPAARALLSEAQPKLAELAEARGIRLGQTSVNGGDAGTANQGARQDAQRTANIPAAPVSAAATAGAGTNEIRVA